MRRLLLLSLFLPLFALGQKRVGDTLYLMNGRVVVAPVLDTLFGAATFIDPEDSTRRSHVENDRLFAIRYHTGAIFYYYEQDTISNWFSREEMWMFMQGERDARKGFRPNGSKYGTFTAGLIGGLTGTIFGPLFPMGYIACVGLPKVRIRHETVSNINFLESDAYILGYEREARGKRRKYALVAGACGLAAGYGAYFLGMRKLYPAEVKVSWSPFSITLVKQ
jgi:hypothetical protein